MAVMQMPAGALYLESVPGDVRDFVVRLLHHALPFASDTAQDAEVLLLLLLLLPPLLLLAVPV